MTTIQAVPISIPLPGNTHHHGRWVENILSSPTSLHLTGSLPRRSATIGSAPNHSSHHEVAQKSLYEASSDIGQVIFPGLPPLHHGSPGAHLQLGIVNAAQLAYDGEPDAEKAFFVADLGVVYQQYQRWIKELPEVTPFYAVKCNPDPYVLRLLASLGTGFDCASNSEIDAVLSLGNKFTASGKQPLVDASTRIIFANPCKASSFIRSAASKNVHTMTFDNSDELHKIKRTNPHARLVLRILGDDSKSLCQLGLKFGAPLSRVKPLLELAKKLELNVVGVAFHVGSGCYDPSVYASSVHLSRTVFNLAASLGFKFKLLDIGGGFEDHLFEEAARVLKESLDEWFADRKEMGLKIIAEPGRFFVSKAFKLACCIIARRGEHSEQDVTSPVDGELDEGMMMDHSPIHSNKPSPRPDSQESNQDDESPKVMYYINDGVYGSFNCTMFDHQVVYPYPLTLASLAVPRRTPTSTCDVDDESQLIPSSVWGPTCDSIDLVCKSTLLPSNLTVGDWLGFDNMGAYTVCAASQFNGFQISRVVYTSGEHPEDEEKRVWELLKDLKKSQI